MVEAVAVGLMTRHPRARLTGRELEVVSMLADGLAAKQIAWRLGISEWTVRSHIASARQKTGSTTDVQLADRTRSARIRTLNRTGDRLAI